MEQPSTDGVASVAAPPPAPSATPATTTLVMVGKTGTGKSATGNLLLGREDAFKSSSSVVGVTAKCRLEETADGSLAIIDTPGLCDDSQSMNGLFNEIGRSVELAGPGGITAILIVLSLATRVTEEDLATIELLAAIFGPKMYEQAVIVWTHADCVADSSLEEYLEGATSRLRTLLKAGGGSVLVENWPTERSVKTRQQVRSEVLTAAQVARTAAGSQYTQQHYEQSQKEFKARKHLGFTLVGNLGRRQARRVRQFLHTMDGKYYAQKQAVGAGDWSLVGWGKFFTSLVAADEEAESNVNEHDNEEKQRLAELKSRPAKDFSV